MMQIGLIGIGAGAAAALLFASVASGAWLSVVLFYLAPLPILIAALGWSQWAGLIAAVTGAAGLFLFFGGVFFFAFLAGAGIPAWWLGHLALLARPVGNGGAPSLEWYPPGRLVSWAALLAVLVVLAAIPNFGTDAASFRAGMHDALTHVLRFETEAPADSTLAVRGVNNTGRLIDFLVAAVPPAAAVLATITNVLNLWLAGRIVKYSGLLKRPWPALSGMTFPKPILALLALAFVASFLGGLIGIVAGVLAAGLTMAYGLLGFAVLHAITRGMGSRLFMLGGAYAAVLVFGWPVLALCLLGMVEAVFDLRARLARRRGPPAIT